MLRKVDLQITEKISWLLTKPKRIKIVVGGRGSQKSIGVADIMLMFCDTGYRVCCAREFQNSIDDSVHENLKQEISRLGIDDSFDIQETRIYSKEGGELFYKGLARNITSLKSLAGTKVLWIEEGQSISEKTLRELTPSIRSGAKDNQDGDTPPEIWITMNRASRNGAVAKKYLSRAEAELARTGYYEDDLMMVVEVNYRDNPWFPQELEMERQDDFKYLSRAEYDHIWEGKYYDQVENSIILPEWFDAAIDAHEKLGFKPLGAITFAHDPSDTGKDPKGYAVRHGSVFLDVGTLENLDINDGCAMALQMAIDYRANAFVWDYGFGAALKKQIADTLEGKGISFESFNGGDGVDFPDDVYNPHDSDTKKTAVTNKDTFKNKRAQYYFYLADRFYNTYRAIEFGDYVAPERMISISSSISRLEQLRSEVCSVPRVFNDNGLKQIMSKPMMKQKLGLESQNMADSMMMSLISVATKKKKTPVRDVEAVNYYGKSR